jgi:glycosyltransferase involved in cell wall biosynthesis
MSEHAHIDAMLVPSIVHENSPFAALESLANGTPVIGSDEPGISHLIAPEHNGWIIPAGQPAAWARAMRDAALQPECIRTMQSTACFRRTTTDFVDDIQKIEMQLCRWVTPPTPTHRAAHAPHQELVPMR